MKLSKNLLQAMTVGLALGATATSCSFIAGEAEVTPETIECTTECDTKCNGHSQTPSDEWDCPPCGLG